MAHASSFLVEKSASNLEDFLWAVHCYIFNHPYLCLFNLSNSNTIDTRQEQEQLDMQIDIDQSLIRDREDRIRQIEVSLGYIVILIYKISN